MTDAPDFTPPEFARASSQAPTPPGRGLAITSFVLGLVGLPTCLPGIAAIVLGIVSLAKKRPGKGFAITGIVLGVLAVPVSSFLVGYQGFEAILMSSSSARSRQACSNNLHQIGIAIASYAHDNSYCTPDSLDQLVKQKYLQSTQGLQCPSCTQTGPGGYFYFSPGSLPKLSDPSAAIVACDYRSSHGGTRNVLYADWHLATMPETKFQRDLQRPENAAFAAALRKAEGP